MTTAVYANPIKLMVLGDSLSAGHKLKPKEAFYSQLQQVLQEKGYQINVINFSKSGETTAGGVAKLKTALAKKPDAVILELGINDLRRGLSLAKAEKNLQSIISTFQDRNIPVLLVGMEAPALAPQAYRDTFRNMYRSLANKNHLMLYPFFMNGLWNNDGTQKDLSYFLQDMAHPSAIGVTIMVQNILPTVEHFLNDNNLGK